MPLCRMLSERRACTAEMAPWSFGVVVVHLLDVFVVAMSAYCDYSKPYLSVEYLCRCMAPSIIETHAGTWQESACSGVAAWRAVSRVVLPVSRTKLKRRRVARSIKQINIFFFGQNDIYINQRENQAHTTIGQ